MPGGKFLKLTTAFVDVTLSADGRKYDTMTVASCIQPVKSVGVAIHELILATREVVASNTTVAAMEAVASKQGVDTSKLKRVNRTGC
jgi:hypothetical protein